MIKGCNIFLILSFLVVMSACIDEQGSYPSNQFIREYLLKINYLGEEELRAGKDQAFLELAHEVENAGQEINILKLNELEAHEILATHPKGKFLKLALIAYRAHALGQPSFSSSITSHGSSHEEMRHVAHDFISLYQEIDQNASLDAKDIQSAIQELKSSLNTALLEARYWPSQLSLPLEEYQNWFLLYRHGNLEGYYKKYFDRLMDLKNRIFNVQRFVDEEGNVFQKESIINDFDKDYRLSWPTDLNMASLQIKHFLWIRNELEIMKDFLSSNQSTLNEFEQTYEPVMLVMTIDHMLYFYGKLLLGQLKWVIMQEMKANGSETLQRKLSKEVETKLLHLDNHSKWVSYVASYWKEAQNQKDFLKLKEFLEIECVFDRLYKTVKASHETIVHELAPPLYVLENRPQWESLWDLVK